jgi:uncharacterized protein (TIGR00251 family)
MIIRRIRVKPGSFKDEIIIDENNEWIVKIRAKPINGEANEYLIKYLAMKLKVNKSSINIEKGTTNQFKTINVHMDTIEFEKRINDYKKLY